MDRKPAKTLRNKSPLELTYRQVELGGTAIPALDRAFDILFDEVLRRKELNVKSIHRRTLTAKNN